MKISQAQINATILETMNKLPTLDKPSPFYIVTGKQIGRAHV